jgi:hypothetical protein
MAMFVHITTVKLARAIKRSGLRPKRRSTLFAMPVVPNFMMTHQWTRELQKWSRQRMVGVYFRIPDDMPVLIGPFNGLKRMMPAAEASARMRAADALGLEIELGLPVSAKDIHAIRSLRGVIGWRHFPGANGIKPCGCPICVARGEPGGRKLRAAFEKSLND